MEPMQAMVLGVVQGLTEFFPVSSSGHLVIFQQMMGLKEPVLLFDVSVHVGTLIAILIYFFKDIIRIVSSLIRSVFRRPDSEAGSLNNPEAGDINMAWMIVAGSVPTALIGAGLHMIADVLFSSLLIVGTALLVTGGVLLGTRWIPREKISGVDGADLSLKQALLIGTIQGLAVVPGISRSGATISAGLFLGINHDTAIRYSFLLSIPAILGALVLEIFTGNPGGGNISPDIILIGLIVSMIVGYGALSLLVRMVQKGHLYFFAPYCILLGGVALIAGW